MVLRGGTDAAGRQPGRKPREAFEVLPILQTTGNPSSLCVVVVPLQEYPWCVGAVDHTKTPRM